MAITERGKDLEEVGHVNHAIPVNVRCAPVTRAPTSDHLKNVRHINEVVTVDIAVTRLFSGQMLVDPLNGRLMRLLGVLVVEHDPERR